MIPYISVMVYKNKNLNYAMEISDVLGDLKSVLMSTSDLNTSGRSPGAAVARGNKMTNRV